ncbi:hypothetical protein GNI_171290 [Gregarina niphandrodes]|uniref:Uncharacterized protein n=1 Tax=Gregarina niphandrodes TaxID=110365 RepID=A0A023AYE2_GRENI|nr:hypothetical protein GNI_171290 [Gregarina niphandrodes]EZG43448.1 hypothetical protein GNI_171290 [Gregarina niphandrodes]|eukprot:XP_011133320.1 hypothetical protein GNI_171290 [Gregarina niphandrodes]
MQGVDTYHWILPLECLAGKETTFTSCWFRSSMSLESWQISTSYELDGARPDNGGDYLGLWLKVNSVTKLAADDHGSVIGLNACSVPIHTESVPFGSEEGWAMNTSTCKDIEKGGPKTAGAETERAGSERAGSERAGSERAGSERAAAERAGSERAGSERAGSARAGSERAGSERTAAADHVEAAPPVLIYEESEMVGPDSVVVDESDVDETVDEAAPTRQEDRSSSRLSVAKSPVKLRSLSMPNLPVSFLNTRYQLSVLGGDGEIVESLCNVWEPCLDPYEYRGCAKFVEVSRLKKMDQIIVRLELQYCNMFGSIQPLTMPASPIAPLNMGLSFGDSVVLVNRNIFCRTRVAVAALNRAIMQNGSMPVIDMSQYVPEHLQASKLARHTYGARVYSACLDIMRCTLYKKCASALDSSLENGIDSILAGRNRANIRNIRLDILVILGSIFSQLRFHYMFHLVKQQLIAVIAGDLRALVRLHETVLDLPQEAVTRFELIVWTELLVVLMKWDAEKHGAEERELIYFMKAAMTHHRALFIELLSRRGVDGGASSQHLSGSWLKPLVFDILVALTNQCVGISLANRKPPGALLTPDALPNGMLHIPYAA